MTSMIRKNGPSPYSQQEFGALKAKPFGGDYQRYVSWWSQNVAPKLAKNGPKNPGTPGYPGNQSVNMAGAGVLSPQDIVRTARGLYPIIDQKTALSQAQGAVSSMMDPVIKQITGAVNQQTEGGRAALEQLAERFANRSGNLGDTIKSRYTLAKEQMAGAADALANFQRGTGADLQASLGSGGGFDFAAAGQGAGAQALGMGFSSLGNLQGMQASEQDYADKLPGIARLYGLQDATQFEGQQSSKLNDMLSALAAQSPQLASQLYSNTMDNNQANRQARGSMFEGNMTRAAQLAATQIGANVDLAGQNASNAFNYAQLNANNAFNYAQLGQQGAIDWAQIANGGTAAAQPSTAGQITPDDVASGSQAAFNNVANNLFPVSYMPGMPPPAQQIMQRVPKGQRSHAYQYLLKQAISGVKGNTRGLNLTDQQIKATAIQILASRGITAPAPKKPLKVGPSSAGPAGTVVTNTTTRVPGR